MIVQSYKLLDDIYLHNACGQATRARLQSKAHKTFSDSLKFNCVILLSLFKSNIALICLAFFSRVTSYYQKKVVSEQV